MLHFLRGADHGGIRQRAFAGSFDPFLGFADQALHGGAGFALGLFVEHLECLFQALHMTLGLLQMAGEGFTEFFAGGGFHHFRERLHQLFFGAVEILHFLDEEVADGFCHGMVPFQV